MTLDDTLAWSWVLAVSRRVGVPGDEGEGWRFLLVSNGNQTAEKTWALPRSPLVSCVFWDKAVLKSVKLRS